MNVRRRGLPLEAAVVWLLVIVVTSEILGTYARLPAHELYHVSGSGLEGGASRALVFLNFPVALIAIAVLALLFEPVRSWAGRAVVVVAAALCSAVFWPGVVSQADLDARPVNAIAAFGVAIAFVLTLGVALQQGIATSGPRRWDRARVALGLGLIVVASPWIAADLGFFLDGVPVLGRLFQTGTLSHSTDGLPAVHHGHHHGMDGLLLVLSALLLSRAVAGVSRRGLRLALGAYLALMFCYGLWNIANDFWTEQVFKRGWTTWQIPNVLQPSLSIAWGILIAAAAVLFVVSARRGAQG